MHKSIFFKNTLEQSLASSSVKTPKTLRFRRFSLLQGRPLTSLKIFNFGLVQWSHYNATEKKRVYRLIYGLANNLKMRRCHSEEQAERVTGEILSL